jgi:hypothetical protein
MELPSDDNGESPFAELPSDDNGKSQFALPRGGAVSFQSTPKRKRPNPVQQRGRLRTGGGADHLDLPDEVVNDELVSDDDFDMPEEVPNDELDDLFGDVANASLNKEYRCTAKVLAKVLWKNKMKNFHVHPGPAAADVRARLVQGNVPDVAPNLSHSLSGALQDDVMEVFSPPRILENTAKLGL